MNPTQQYGTPEYYSQLFQDILADIEPEVSPDAANNIYKGFLLAMDSWIDYHNSQLIDYLEFKARVTKALGEE